MGAISGRSIGTLVPHEGGPGYSTTGSGEWFAEMYADLMTDHDMLLVDQRQRLFEQRGDRAVVLARLAISRPWLWAKMAAAALCATRSGNTSRLQAQPP